MKFRPRLCVEKRKLGWEIIHRLDPPGALPFSSLLSLLFFALRFSQRLNLAQAPAEFRRTPPSRVTLLRSQIGLGALEEGLEKIT